MCLPVAAVAAVASTAASIGGQFMSYGAAQDQADATNAYNAQVRSEQLKYRVEQTQYLNTNYAKEIQYGGQVLNFQQAEFARQERFVDRQQDAIQKNYFGQIGALLARRTQEAMAAAFQTEGVERAGRAGRAAAQVQADARGVEGSSVEQIMNDIYRQEGDASNMIDLNHSATQAQLVREAGACPSSGFLGQQAA